VPGFHALVPGFHALVPGFHALVPGFHALVPGFHADAPLPCFCSRACAGAECSWFVFRTSCSPRTTIRSCARP
jgi:hypothetical protein